MSAYIDVFFDEIVNPFMGAGALGQVVDDFNGDNFDHGPHGFIGGAYLSMWTTGGRPILQHYLPDGTPAWGSQWKRAMHENYLRASGMQIHGSVMSYRQNYLDLDPTYRDIYGSPLLRMTFDFQPNAHAMMKFTSQRAIDIAKAVKGVRGLHKRAREGHYGIVEYQTTHNTGGAILGENPRDSV